MSTAPPPYLVWVDPGGMTGIASLVRGTFHVDEYPFDEACDQLTSMADWTGRHLHLGYEKFTILPSTHKLSPQPEAYELPGVIKYLAHKYRCVLLKPAMPSERNTASAAELAALGWWLPGKNDAQSASQHLLSYLKRENCVPPELEIKLARARSGTV